MMKITADNCEGGYVVFYPEMPGCITCGETIAAALANAKDAKEAWLEAAEKGAMSDGKEI